MWGFPGQAGDEIEEAKVCVGRGGGGRYCTLTRMDSKAFGPLAAGAPRSRSTSDTRQDGCANCCIPCFWQPSRCHQNAQAKGREWGGGVGGVDGRRGIGNINRGGSHPWGWVREGVEGRGGEGGGGGRKIFCCTICSTDEPASGSGQSPDARQGRPSPPQSRPGWHRTVSVV